MNSGDTKLWKSTIFVLILLAAFSAFSSFKYADPDLWGHIKFGQEICETKSAPHYDTYSYTADKTFWINHEWLSEVIFYRVYKHCGSTGLVIFKTIIGLLLTLMLWQIASLHLKNPWMSAPVLLILSVNVVTFGFAIRPQIFTYFLFTLYLYLLVLYRQRKRNCIFFIPLLMVAWVNLHGGFLAGIGVLILYLVSESLSLLPALKDKFDSPLNDKELKTLFMIFILSLAASLCNPYHIRLWFFLARTLSQTRPYIWEWFPVELNIQFLDYGLLIAISLILILFARAKIAFSHLCLFACTLIISLKQVRHLPFFGIAAFILTPLYLEHLVFNRKKDLNRFLKVTNVAFLLLAAFLFLYEESPHKGRDFFKVRVDSDYYPIRMVNFMKENYLEGNVLVDFDWGEYFIWKLSPQCKVSIDGRYKTVYPAELIKEYSDFLYAKDNWKDFLDKYPHDWILVRKFRPVVRLLAQHPDWVIIYSLKGSPAIFLAKKDSSGYRQLLRKKDLGHLVLPQEEVSTLFP